MKNNLNEIQSQKMITLLTYEIKKAFKEETDNVKSMKQLNFMLKNDEAMRSQFEAFQSQSSISKTIEALENAESELPEDNKELFESLVEKAISYAEKEEKRAVSNDKPLSENAQKSETLFDDLIHYYQNILELHQKGEYKTEWKKGWETSNMFFSLARNLEGYQYNLTNQLILQQTQQEEGLPVSVFLTPKQLDSFGIKEDEKPFPITNILSKGVIYKDENGKTISYKKYESLSEAQKEKCSSVFFQRPSPVFHPEQFKQSHPEIYEEMKSQISEYEIAEKLQDKEFAKNFYDEKMQEALVDLLSYIQEEDISLRAHDAQCFYRPSDDSISMVKDVQFEDGLEFIGTFAHECIHSTGVKERNNRKNFTSPGIGHYGFEELVAEMGSRVFMAKYNLPAALDENSAAYIVSWSQALKGSPNQKLNLFQSASKQAIEGSDFISKKAEKYQSRPDFELHRIQELSNKIVDFEFDKKPNSALEEGQEKLNSGKERLLEMSKQLREELENNSRTRKIS